MRRDVMTMVAAALLALLVFGLAGCGQGSEANQALADANAQLDKYDKLAAQTAVVLGQLQTVQPTGSSVNRGLELLDVLDKNIAARDKTAGGATTAFQKIKGMQVKKEVVGYADRAMKYTEALRALDEELAKLSTDYRNLFEQVKKKGAVDAIAVQSLTTKIDQQTQVVDAQRLKAQALLDAVDKYYQQNLVGGK
jgi:hypothetical protein